MSKSMMYNMYFGNLTPMERGRSQDPDYTTISRKISDIKAHFENFLSPEEYKELEELENLRADIRLIEEAELFEYAFSMAVLMMIDVFSFKEKQLDEQGNE